LWRTAGLAGPGAAILSEHFSGEIDRHLVERPGRHGSHRRASGAIFGPGNEGWTEEGKKNARFAENNQSR